MSKYNETQQLHRNRHLDSISLEEHVLNNLSSELSPTIDENEENVTPSKRTKEDLGNIMLIFFMYALQSVPTGLLMSIPLILSARKVSYADQGTLSFASWPFAVKILWAPIVDSIYVKRIGRRKCWIIAVQLIIGIVVFSSGNYLNKILGVEATRKKLGKLSFFII
jgi:PAT family acetyl-CoA transporter-like MFS transporter 1